MRSLLIAGIILVLGAAVLLPSADLDFGSPQFTDMDAYMVRFGQALTGANNIVTSVVFDFRGFDTLGEATVLFTAVLGSGLALRRHREDEEYEYE